MPCLTNRTKTDGDHDGAFCRDDKENVDDNFD